MTVAWHCVADDCDWSVELEADEQPAFICPQCGARTEPDHEPQELDPEDTLSDKI